MPRDLSCADCRQPMWRGKGSLPQGQATCRSCRRARWDALLLSAQETCRICGKDLSHEQRRRGGQFCSTACGYVHIMRIQPAPYLEDHKRFRRLGVCRGVDEDTGLVFHGPGRRQKFSLHRYDDGRWTICCRQCADHVPIELGQMIVRCRNCDLISELDRPLEEVSDGSPTGTRRRATDPAAWK